MLGMCGGIDDTLEVGDFLVGAMLKKGFTASGSSPVKRSE
jgi:hypothetical protein